MKKVMRVTLKNEKIFDPEIQEMLLQFTTDDEIAKAQAEIIYEHALKTLEEITRMFKEKKFTSLLENGYTFDSPSGDCMGLDNTCIDFGMKFWRPLTDFGNVLKYLNEPYLVEKLKR